MKAFNRNFLATFFGLITSILTALAAIDFSNFDLLQPNNWLKLIVISLPAIGGYISEIKDRNFISNKKRSKLATLIGALTSVFTALMVIDFNNFDFTKKENWFKVFVVLMPVIGGYNSTLKPSAK